VAFENPGSSRQEKYTCSDISVKTTEKEMFFAGV
jgi:hypothetical protein